MTSIKKPFNPMDDAVEFEDNDKDNESNSDEDKRHFLEKFLKNAGNIEAEKSEPMLSYWKLNN